MTLGRATSATKSLLARYSGIFLRRAEAYSGNAIAGRRGTGLNWPYQCATTATQHSEPFKVKPIKSVAGMMYDRSATLYKGNMPLPGCTLYPRAMTNHLVVDHRGCQRGLFSKCDPCQKSESLQKGLAQLRNGLHRLMSKPHRWRRTVSHSRMY